jgi:hypothetical protein
MTNPMPSDPTFKTREALDAWLENEASAVNERIWTICPIEAAKTGNRIRRVTLAHAHLLKERNDEHHNR